jgi:hypothetical protein
MDPQNHPPETAMMEEDERPALRPKGHLGIDRDRWFIGLLKGPANQDRWYSAYASSQEIERREYRHQY